MSETRNIVIVGASLSGLGTAHYIAKHVLPTLVRSQDAKYQLHLVDPSTHFWWHIGAPRELVSLEKMPHEKYFKPIADGFKQYPDLKDSIVFHHGSATTLDTAARTIAVDLATGGSTTLPYWALVIATGTSTPTPLTSLHGDHTISQRALEQANIRLAAASTVAISGGGPIGVESAGEIAAHFPSAKITLYAGGEKLLPVLSESRAKKAQRALEKAGVTVVYNVKTTDAKETASGQTELTLSNGQTELFDFYLPATGATPNTAWLPATLKDDRGYVVTNPQTLRVDGAAPLVWAAGDVAGVDNGGVVNMFASLPVLHNNIALDLFAAAAVTTPKSRAEKAYKYKEAETQLVPIGPKTGIGAFNGFGLPSFMVSMFKGKDYMAAEIPKWTEGKQFVKV